MAEENVIQIVPAQSQSLGQREKPWFACQKGAWIGHFGRTKEEALSRFLAWKPEAKTWPVEGN